MKNFKLSITPLLLVFLLTASACGGAQPVQEPAGEASSPTQADRPAVAPTQPEPTEAPAPIPCTIVFESDRDGNREIYVMEPDGSNPRNLSNHPADDFNPVWSPDGSQIAFVSNRKNEQGCEQCIYVMNADGEDVRLLIVDYYSDNPSWSPDGKRITYASGEDIYVINADGSGEPINLTGSPEKDVRPAWSPDGSQIAWLSGDGGNWNIFVMDVEGGNIRQLTDTSDVGGFQWTVEGRIFTGWSWKDQEPICQNCLVNADGSNIEEAGGKGELARHLPFWTQDGKQVECVSANFNEPDNEIYLLGEAFPDFFFNLTKNPAQDTNPDWPAQCGPVTGAPEEKQEQEQPQAAPPSGSGEMVIGYAVVGDNPRKEEQILKACGELGIQCIRGENLTDLVDQKVNAIVYVSNRWDVLGSFPQIHTVAEKMIPLFVVDAETTEQGAYNLSIESDALQTSLVWMIKEMGDQGELVYFNTSHNDYYQELIDNLLKDYPGIQATSLPSDFENPGYTEASIAQMVRENPDLGAIWSSDFLNDIFWGLNSMEGDQKLPLTVCPNRIDFFQSWMDIINSGSSFRCISTIAPGGAAYEGIYAAYYMLSGAELDPQMLGGYQGNTLLYDFPVITNENLEEWLGKLDSLQRGDNETLEMPPMTPDEIRERWFLD